MRNTPSSTSLAIDDADTSHPPIARLVAQTERVEGLIPNAIMAFFIGMPLITTLLRGHPVMAIINAVLLGLIGTVIARVVSSVLLAPFWAMRYRVAARTLDAALAFQAPAATFRRSWSDFAPGALAIVPTGHVLLVDRTTRFAIIRLDARQIADVEIGTDASVRMTERRRPALMLAIPLGGVLAGLTVPGRVTTAARIAERRTLALRYQLAANGPVLTGLIPFGSDRHGAVSLKLALDRLRCPPFP